jgi:meiotically up-regulated gene 157 (Mug157) protein
MLITTTAGTGLMHESFKVDDASDFTRSWFAWANGVFAEAVLQLVSTRPALLIKTEYIEQA